MPNDSQPGALPPVPVGHPHIPASARGEQCWCGAEAVRKVEESILYDDPQPIRHPLTSYICAAHFAQLMGPAGALQVGAVLLAHDGATPEGGEARDEARADEHLISELRDAGDNYHAARGHDGYLFDLLGKADAALSARLREQRATVARQASALATAEAALESQRKLREMYEGQAGRANAAAVEAHSALLAAEAALAAERERALNLQAELDNARKAIAAEGRRADALADAARRWRIILPVLESLRERGVFSTVDSIIEAAEEGARRAALASSRAGTTGGATP